MKKILFAISASAVLFLAAGQVLAAAYAPVSGSSALTNNQQEAASLQPTPQGIRQETPIMFNGNGQGNEGYTTFSAQPAGLGMISTYASRAAFWLALASFITTVLVWIVLIELIFVLCHWLKHHKH